MFREPRQLERFAVVDLVRFQDCHIVLNDPCELGVAEKFYDSFLERKRVPRSLTVKQLQLGGLRRVLPSCGARIA
jgi:hypothetical protein